MKDEIVLVKTKIKDKYNFASTNEDCEHCLIRDVEDNGNRINIQICSQCDLGYNYQIKQKTDERGNLGRLDK